MTHSSACLSNTARCTWQYWTGIRNFGLWPQASLHTQWPGTGLRGDPSFTAFLASQVQSNANQTHSETLARAAGAALLDKIGPAFLLTHSQGGPHGFVIADARPGLTKGLISIEPQGPPFVNAVIVSTGVGIVRPYGITQGPIAYDPPISSPQELVPVNITSSDPGVANCTLQADPPRRLANLSQIPMLMVTSEAGYHAVYDPCTVRYLKQAGVALDWLNLPEVGIKGNSHFMFMELNNLDIAAKIQEWVVGVEGELSA